MMKFILSILVVITSVSVFAQEDGANIAAKNKQTNKAPISKGVIVANNSQEPKVSHTITKPSSARKNLHQKISILTNDDAYLTELVLKEIYTTKPNIINLVSDEKYNNFSLEDKKKYLSHTQVFQLINNSKAK